jgi:dienelactone hydrolase
MTGLVATTAVVGVGLFGLEYSERMALKAHREELLENTAPLPSDRNASPWVLTEPVDRSREFKDFTVDGRQVAHALPEDMRALVFLFHGTGGSRKAIDLTEFRAVTSVLLDAGFGIVAPDSQERGADCKFDATGPRAGNKDIARMIAIHRGLREAGILGADTPLYLLGYSAGGRFAGYAGHVLLEAGLPISGIAYHQSRGRTDLFGDPPRVPSIWLAADNDGTVKPASVVWEYDEHIKAGHKGLVLRHVAHPLDRGWFTRDPRIDAETSAELFDRAVAAGIVDARGVPIQQGSMRERVQKAVEGMPSPAREAAKAQLLVLNATHAFNGEYATRERDFFVAQLPTP